MRGRFQPHLAWIFYGWDCYNAGPFNRRFIEVSGPFTVTVCEAPTDGGRVALAGIEPAPLHAQRAPYTKGSTTLGLWGSSTIPPTATPAAT